MKKVLVIASDTIGCGKYRSIDPHLMLRKMYPDDFDVYVMLNNEIPHTNLPTFLKDVDIVHIHKGVDNDAMFAQVCKFLGKKLILDLDDHFQLDPTHPMYLLAQQEKWNEKVLKHLKYADLVTTTTKIYQNTLLKYNKNVAVLPNAIDSEEEQFIPKPNNNPSKRLRVGLVCGSTHLEDIKLLEGIIDNFTKEEIDKIQFVLCGFDTRGFKRILNPDGSSKLIPILPSESVYCEYEKILTNNYSIVSSEYKNALLKYDKNITFNSENEPYQRFWVKPISEYGTHYNNIDVLLAPLVENTFNSVKSQLKVIEAGFLKKGIIASNFGPYTLDLINILEPNGTIQPNGNSILIDNRKGTKQWSDAIKFLLNNHNILQQMQNNLNEIIKNKYSLQEITKVRKEIYLSLF